MDQAPGGEKKSSGVLRILVLTVAGVLVLYFLGFVLLGFGRGSGSTVHGSTPETTIPIIYRIEMLDTDSRAAEIQKAATAAQAEMPREREVLVVSFDDPLDEKTQAKIKEAYEESTVIVGIGAEAKELLAVIGVGGSNTHDLGGRTPIAWCALQPGGWYSSGIEGLQEPVTGEAIAQLVQHVVETIQEDLILVNRLYEERIGS